MQPMHPLHRHAHWIALAALVISVLGFGFGYVASRNARAPIAATSPAPAIALASPVPDEPPPAAEPVGAACPNNAAFAAHTYNPQRLAVLKACVTVTGVVDVVRHEADGDEHVLLRLDPAFAGMTNSVNDSQQKGDLVLEPQCVLSVSQADAIGPCQGSPPVPGLQLLRVGAHVKVTGPYVLDQQHGWNEIHSVELVEPA